MPEGASVRVAAADRRELFVWSQRRAEAPTERRPVKPQGAGMHPAAANGREPRALWGRCLAVLVVSPANRRTVVPERAGVGETAAQRGWLGSLSPNDGWRPSVSQDNAGYNIAAVRLKPPLYSRLGVRANRVKPFGVGKSPPIAFRLIDRVASFKPSHDDGEVRCVERIPRSLRLVDEANVDFPITERVRVAVRSGAKDTLGLVDYHPSVSADANVLQAICGIQFVRRRRGSRFGSAGGEGGERKDCGGGEGDPSGRAGHSDGYSTARGVRRQGARRRADCIPLRGNGGAGRGSRLRGQSGKLRKAPDE